MITKAELVTYLERAEARTGPARELFDDISKHLPEAAKETGFDDQMFSMCMTVFMENGPKSGVLSAWLSGFAQGALFERDRNNISALERMVGLAPQPTAETAGRKPSAMRRGSNARKKRIT